MKNTGTKKQETINEYVGFVFYPFKPKIAHFRPVT